MPAALYLGTDMEFAECVLPQGEWGWEARHEGSGGGEERMVNRPPTFLPSSFHSGLFRNVETSGSSSSPSPSVDDSAAEMTAEMEEHRARCRRQDEERCPMIHRVFSRIDDAGTETELSEFWKGWAMPRPRIDVLGLHPR